MGSEKVAEFKKKRLGVTEITDHVSYDKRQGQKYLNDLYKLAQEEQKKREETIAHTFIEEIKDLEKNPNENMHKYVEQQVENNSFLTDLEKNPNENMHEYVEQQLENNSFLTDI